MAYVIALDLGNVNIFTSFIRDMDEETRRGGHIYDLIDDRAPSGIPSIYFYSQKVGSLVGNSALTGRAVPLNNRKDLLKRNLGKTFECDGKTISYDDALKEVVEYAVRYANKILHQQTMQTTNLISLAYPAVFLYNERCRLEEIVESATLEDGRHLEVVGTIAEPAAAALDYLSEYAKEDTKVLVFDLGGGTFDIALVQAFPQGRHYENGDIYYYDCLAVDGERVGGADFRDKMFEILCKKMGNTPKGQAFVHVTNEAEKLKKELSELEEVTPTLMNPETGDFYDFTVTRAEFEKATKDLLDITIDRTRKILENNNISNPDIILLTGGASQMPMIEEALENNFPEYKGKIESHKPQKAISYGAARFGVKESSDGFGNGNTNEQPEKKSTVRRRTMYDYGDLCQRAADGQRYISTMIDASTPIPYEGEFRRFRTIQQGKTVTISINEAKHQNPDNFNIDDYVRVAQVTFHFDKVMPAHTPIEERMSVDENNVIHLEARDPENPQNTVHCEYEITKINDN